MQVFLIHRSADKAAARCLLKKIAKERQIALFPFVMNSSRNDSWKDVARTEIERSEAVVVFNEKSCLKSENAMWEIDVAKKLNKPLVFLDSSETDSKEVDSLCSVYHHDEEFDSYLGPQKRLFINKKQSGEKEKEIIELYKVMVTSSEQLIQRRQSMNSFFIAAIGSVLALAGALIKFGNVESTPLFLLVMAFLSITGIILCYSWHNLIDNYGKLNKAKFRVITKLEEALSVQIFSAEWAALGKGFRHDKYKSFTSTEKNIPLGFATLIALLFVLTVGWHFWASPRTETRDSNRAPTFMCSASVTLEKSDEVKPKQAPSQRRKSCPSDERRQ